LAIHNIKELSIQINLNGLSFCILNRSQNTIEYLKTLDFKCKLSPFDVLNRLKTELIQNSTFSDDFAEIHVIHQNELATLVPADFYDEACKADYLKFNSKILKTDFITHDEIHINKAVNVYVPYVNINNYIFETFGEFVYKHASSVLIDSILQKEKPSEPTAVYVNVGLQSMECLVIENQQLQLYNYFDFYSKEDFIYYLLFVYEQLGLNAESTPIIFSGSISKNDDLYNIAYKYIRHVSFMPSEFGFKFHDDIETSSLHRHFLILNSF
jgi:hypothetical protein